MQAVQKCIVIFRRNLYRLCSKVGVEHLPSTIHKKWRFPLKISLVNVNKSSGNCRFVHNYWRNSKRKTSLFMQWQTSTISLSFLMQYCKKYARIRVFTNPYSPVYGQNLWFYPYTGEYGLVETRILGYFLQIK